MKGILKNINGKIEFRARGVKLKRFINAVRNEGIVCLRQYTKYEEYYGIVSYLDYKKLEKLAMEYQIELFNEKTIGFLPLAVKYRKRYGMILGIVVALCFIFYVSNTVLEIEVIGNSTVKTDRIIAAVSELGVTKGTFIPHIEYAYTEKLLLLEAPELSWVRLKTNGNKLVISVAEKKTQPEIIGNEPCNVVAAKDAIITDVVVYDGQLERIIGDTVTKGDLIIGGVYSAGGNLLRKTHAAGKITGIYTESVVFTQPFAVKHSDYGDKDVSKQIEFFGIKLGFAISEKENTNLSQEYTPYKIFGKDIPIGVIKTTRQEIIKTVTEYDKDAAGVMLEQQVIDYENNFLSDADVISRKSEYSENEQQLQLKMVYKIEGEIGKETDLFIK